MSTSHWTVPLSQNMLSLSWLPKLSRGTQCTQISSNGSQYIAHRHPKCSPVSAWSAWPRWGDSVTCSLGGVRKSSYGNSTVNLMISCPFLNGCLYIGMPSSIIDLMSPCFTTLPIEARIRCQPFCGHNELSITCYPNGTGSLSPSLWRRILLQH